MNHGIIPQRACFFCITELYKALNSLFLLQSDQDIPICFDDLDSYFEAPILSSLFVFFPLPFVLLFCLPVFLNFLCFLSLFSLLLLISLYSPLLLASILPLFSHLLFIFFQLSCFLLFLSSLSLHSASSFFSTLSTVLKFK